MSDVVQLPVEWPQVLPCVLEPKEVAYCLYMPVSIPGRGFETLEYRRDLNFVKPMLHEIQALEPKRVQDEYVYLTVKRMIVGPTVTPNRPGWHADGFGSDDLNFIWYDSVPTLLSIRPFCVSNDHLKSLEQFDTQAEHTPEHICNIPPGHIIRLTPNIVHRVNLATEECMRTFVKVTVSKNQFNLTDNSTHPNVARWPTFDRAAVRNDPSRAQLDYAATPADDHVEAPASLP